MKQIINSRAIFPILEIEGNCIISETGPLTLAFEIGLPEIFQLSEEKFDSLTQAWTKAIQSLPYGTIIHKQDWYARTRYAQSHPERMDSPINPVPHSSVYTQACNTKASPETPQGFFGTANEAHFTARPYLHHRSFLFLTQRPGPSGRSSALGFPGSRSDGSGSQAPWSGNRNSFGHFSSLLSGQLVPSALLDANMIKDFKHSGDIFCSILSNTGLLTVREMAENELRSTLHRAGLIEQYLQLSIPNPDPSSPQDLVLRDISFDKGLFIGSTECAVFTISDAEKLPETCSSCIPHRLLSTDNAPLPIGLSSPLGLLLPCNHIVNQLIITEDPQPRIKAFELKRRRLHSLSLQSRNNTVVMNDIDAFLSEAASGNKQIVKAALNIIAWADPGEDIREINKNVSTAISQLGVTPHQETVIAPLVWWGCIPGNASEYPGTETFDTFSDTAACLLIPDTGARSSASPQGIRLCDRLFGTPLRIDLTEEPMRNMSISTRSKLVIGGSGSGKSYLINHFLHSYHSQGVHTLIVDIGGSYKHLVRYLNGYEFVYTDQHPICFNPFYIPQGATLDTEKKESLKTLLLTIWKKEEEPTYRSEYIAISNALQDFYGFLEIHPDIFPCFNSFYDFLEDRYGPKLASEGIREKDFDIRSFLYVLRPYYDGGEFDHLLNAREQLDLLHQPLILFELDNVRDHPILFPVITLIIMEVFLSKIRRLPGIRKAIIIEEAWVAIAKTGMSEYIRYLFKTIRKHYGEPIIVTQEADDLLSSPIIRNSIINNVDCRIILDQSKLQNRFHEIASLLGLSKHDQSLVLSLNKANASERKYKEVFVNLGAYSMVYAVEVSPEEHLLFTSEEAEKIKVKQYAERHGSLEAGIAALAAEIRSGKNTTDNQKSHFRRPKVA